MYFYALFALKYTGKTRKTIKLSASVMMWLL